MMDQPQEQRLSFGPFVLERANARLLRDGRDIPLSPKAFDVLAHLAGRPDQLVSKGQLLARVWPDVVVSDASVKVCIREIRKALEDDADSPRFIATVHRRGYRFVAPVNAMREAAAAAAVHSASDSAWARPPTVAAGSPDRRFLTPPPPLLGRG